MPDASVTPEAAADEPPLALIEFARRLQEIRRMHGNPSIRELVRIMNRSGAGYARTTINAKLLGRSKPTWNFLVAFVAACEEHATAADGVDLKALRIEYSGLIERLSRAARESTPPRPAPAAAEPEGGQGAELDLNRHLPVHTTVSIAAPVAQLTHAVHGRDGIIAELETALSAAAGSLHVLTGIGGSGKTTTALELARRNAGRMPIFWVSASEPAALTAGMRQTAVALGVPETLAASAFAVRQSAVDCLWATLAEQRSPWLMIIDNADDPRLLLANADGNGTGNGWLRMPSQGVVLITSRASGWATWIPGAAIHRIECLDAEDGANLLFDLTGGVGGPAGDARALAGRLGGHPLALSIAGAYIASTASVAPWTGLIRDFRAYTAALDTEFTQVIEAQPFRAVGNERDDRRNVARTWELSLDLLEELGVAAARPLLRLLSSFGPAPIPYLMLLDPAELSRTGYWPDASFDSIARALHALAEFNLVDLHLPLPGADDRLGHRVTIHPVVRDANASFVSRANRSDMAALTVTLLANSLDTEKLDIPEDPGAWAGWHALMPHALHLFSHIAGPGNLPSAEAQLVLQACRMAGLAARHLHTQGLYEQSEHVGRRVWEITVNALGEHHPDALVAQHALARILHARGRLGEAESMLQDLLQIRRRLCGDLSPVTLTTRYSLARVLHARGRLDSARSELEELLQIRTPMLGAESAPILSIRHNLASLLQAQGRLNDAESEFRQVLEISERVLGDKHPRTMATRHGLARALHSRGRVREAHDEYRHVLEIRSHVLGSRHPDTLTTRHALAAALHSIGQRAEAEAELRIVLDLRRSVLGDEHPHTLTTQNKLARVLRVQQRFDEARAEYEVVLAIRRRVLGEDHPHTENTRQKLAAVNRHLTAGER